MRFRALCIAALVWVAAPASAQSTYVAAGVGADIFRPSGIEASGFDESRGGEAVAWSLRLGTAVTDRWGVEVGFTRPAEIEREIRGGYPLPLLSQVSATGQIGAGGVPPPNILTTLTALPIFESAIRLSRRSSTLDAIAWVAQPVGNRVDLIYLGGVAFARTVEEMDFSLTRRIAVFPIIAPTSTRTTTYDAGPVVGLEGRLALADRAVLIPGIRLHGVSTQTGGGWLVRPSVALGWRF
jgi:hypothetical protein